MLELPDDLRGAFKEPLGSVFTDPESLLAADDAGTPLVAVGDVVTAHLLDAGHHPYVAIIDGRTERERVDESISRRLPEPDIEVANPPATLSRALLDALVTALDRDDPTVIGVDGEEDLAALPAILATPEGGCVVYGQPGDGMVLVPVTDETQSLARDLLGRMTGDTDAALELL
ncbi:MAG: GTP-dependent dephospho-CoA kinase family protein [Haloplanus sp.]